DVERKRIGLKGLEPVDYDYLVIGLGMVSAYFGNNEWAKHSIGLKSLDEARRIRRQILHAYESAEATRDPERRKQLMTHVVIGGGPTGVEMAGAISELTKRAFKKDFRSISPEESRVILVEAAPRILGPYTEESSAKATEDLKKLGVEVLTDSPVKDVRAGEVELKDQTIESESIIWTAGVEANPVLRSIPAEFDRQGRISVEKDTSLPGYPEVFVIGDVANMTDVKGRKVPGVSPAAMQMGRHAAKIIKKELNEFRKIPVKERKPFKYFDKGTMATIGRSKAVAEIHGLKFSGPLAWLLWLAVHLIFLVGFRNKATVLLQWAYAYIGYRPGARVFDLRIPDPAVKTEKEVEEKV
ncbi:MAG TPA: NAD(P)/FAD-dependent oxidoreductase, partial [Opitutales bacterium]|nr:NAD(P)/FAD-dependent oxidoreductase [Opitutales bacterium]